MDQTPVLGLFLEKLKKILSRSLSIYQFTFSTPNILQVIIKVSVLILASMQGTLCFFIYVLYIKKCKKKLNNVMLPQLIEVESKGGY